MPYAILKLLRLLSRHFIAIMESLVEGEAPITLEWENTSGEYQAKRVGVRVNVLGAVLYVEDQLLLFVRSRIPPPTSDVSGLAHLSYT